LKKRPFGDFQSSKQAVSDAGDGDAGGTHLVEAASACFSGVREEHASGDDFHHDSPLRHQFQRGLVNKTWVSISGHQDIAAGAGPARRSGSLGRASSRS